MCVCVCVWCVCVCVCVCVCLCGKCVCIVCIVFVMCVYVVTYVQWSGRKGWMVVEGWDREHCTDEPQKGETVSKLRPSAVIAHSCYIYSYSTYHNYIIKTAREK